MGKHENGVFYPSRGPAPEVVTFQQEHPLATWAESLRFVIRHFPQGKPENPIWVLEGSAAVFLLHPGQRPVPNDLDIITPSRAFAHQFSHARGIEVKTLDFWFTIRGLRVNSKRSDYVIHATQAVDFEGTSVLVMHPGLLAVSKLLPYGSHDPRPQDTLDIQLLNVSPDDISETLAVIRGNRARLPVLQAS